MFDVWNHYRELEPPTFSNDKALEEEVEEYFQCFLLRIINNIYVVKISMYLIEIIKIDIVIYVQLFDLLPEYTVCK